MKTKMTAWGRLNFLKKKGDKTPQEHEEQRVLEQSFMLYAKLKKLTKGV